MKQWMLFIVAGVCVWNVETSRANSPETRCGKNLPVACLSATDSSSELSQTGLTPLQQAVVRLDSARTADDWLQARTRFERLSSVETEAWLPYYYLAFTDIELFFRTPDEKQRMLYLEDASQCVDKLKDLKRKDPKERSEIAALRGYLFYARVAANPAENGAKYAGAVISFFQEALKLNPENPRALLLHASFRRRMADTMHQTYEVYETEMQRAAALLQQPVSPVEFPHWGKMQMAY